MARTIGRVLAAAVALAIVLVPASSALAVDPPQTPAPIITEGFETAYPSYLDVSAYQIPGDPPTAAWWGRITGSKYAGSYGLWAAGQGGTWGSNYPIRTRGTATFDVPELADYYSSEASFRYVMPTKGASDQFYTRWAVDAYSPSPGFDVQTEALSSGWILQSYDLAATANSVNLSRSTGDVQFFFFDFTEPSGVTPTQGQGPTIDDVTIAGFKYGPVRDLDSVQAGGEVHLDWLKPYRATGSTTVEERSVEYRVWRAPGTGPSYTWTELTSGRISATDYVDDTAVGGQTYTYLVQAWDPGSGTGYGEVATVEQEVTSVLQVAVTANKTNIAPGEFVTFTYRVTNVGDADVTGVTVTDSLGNSIPAGTIAQNTTWSDVVVKQINATTTNDVTASGTYQGGPVSGMGSATVTVRIPDISLTVTAADTSLPYGGTAQLTYKAKNTGNTTLTNVKVTDPLIGTFTLASSLAPGATASTAKTKTLYADATSEAEVTASSSYGSAGDTAAAIQFDVAAEPPAPVFPTGVDRLAGTDRIDTAVKASQTAFTGPLSGEKAVVVATAWGWADALPASALAGSVDGPLLLVNPDSVPASVLAEMDRLGADKVYIVGGTGVVGSSVGTQLANAGLAVERVAGTTRYGTARAVAAKVVEKEGQGGTVFVATGLNFPDALAASSLAARMKGPIVLTLAGTLPSDTQVALRAVAPDEIVVCGGAGVVSAGVEQQLAGYAPEVTRQAGSNRYDTAKALVEWGEAELAPGGPGGVWVATGTNYPDALAGGVLAGIGYDEWIPLMLTDPAALSPQVTSYIQANPSIGFAGILGGTGAVSPAVGAQLAQLVQ